MSTSIGKVGLTSKDALSYKAERTETVLLGVLHKSR